MQVIDSARFGGRRGAPRSGGSIENFTSTSRSALASRRAALISGGGCSSAGPRGTSRSRGRRGRPGGCARSPMNRFADEDFEAFGERRIDLPRPLHRRPDVMSRDHLVKRWPRRSRRSHARHRARSGLRLTLGGEAVRVGGVCRSVHRARVEPRQGRPPRGAMEEGCTKSLSPRACLCCKSRITGTITAMASSNRDRHRPSARRASRRERKVGVSDEGLGVAPSDRAWPYGCPGEYGTRGAVLNGSDAHCRLRGVTWRRS